MKQIPNKIILVIGPPCSGKTGLTIRLNDVFRLLDEPTRIVRQDARESDRHIQRRLCEARNEVCAQYTSPEFTQFTKDLMNATNAVMKTSRPVFTQALATDAADAFLQGDRNVIMEFNIRTSDELRAFQSQLAETMAACVDTGPTEIFVVDVIPTPERNLERAKNRALPHDLISEGILGEKGMPGYLAQLEGRASNGLNCPDIQGWIPYNPGDQTEIDMCSGVLAAIEGSKGLLVTPTNGSGFDVGNCTNNFLQNNEDRWLSILKNPRIMDGDSSITATRFLKNLDTNFLLYPETISQPVVDTLHGLFDSGKIHPDLLLDIENLLEIAYENGKEKLAPRPITPKGEVASEKTTAEPPPQP